MPRDELGIAPARVLERRAEERLHRGEAPLPIALQRAVHEVGDLGRQAGDEAGDARRPLLADLLHHHRRRGRLERTLPGDQLVEHGAEGPDVRAGVDGPAVGLLRRHVRGRADDHAEPRVELAVAVRHARDPEVDELGRDLARGPAREEDVLGLDVAVDDVLPVRGGERAHDRDEDLERLLHREPAARREVAPQAGAVEQLLHDVVRPVAPLPDLEHVDDVGVVDARRRARLAAEAVHHVRSPGDVRVQHLERHVPPDQRVSFGLEHDARRALPELPEQDELPRPPARAGGRRALPPPGIVRTRLHLLSLLASSASSLPYPGPPRSAYSARLQPAPEAWGGRAGSKVGQRTPALGYSRRHDGGT